jgi:hypothetical protein
MIETDVLKEAERIISTAENQQITLRLLGGTAIGIRCPSAKHRAVARTYPDIDLIGLKKQSRAIRGFFMTMGYEENKMFNALRGSTRLMFFDIPNKRRIDIFLDYFDMCHRFELSDRLTIDPKTLSMADLLATKLQVVKTNEKDIKDMVALLLDHEVATSDEPEKINGMRLAKLCADDWGIYKTFTSVLAKVLVVLEKLELTPDEKMLVKDRIERISKMIEDEPKSLKWRMRARVGEKAVWYKMPEDLAE